jgi:hypothetical protein
MHYLLLNGMLIASNLSNKLEIPGLRHQVLNLPGNGSSTDHEEQIWENGKKL